MELSLQLNVFKEQEIIHLLFIVILLLLLEMYQD